MQAIYAADSKGLVTTSRGDKLPSHKMKVLPLPCSARFPAGPWSVVVQMLGLSRLSVACLPASCGRIQALHSVGVPALALLARTDPGLHTARHMHGIS